MAEQPPKPPTQARNVVPKPPAPPPPDAGHIPITEEMDKAKWTLPPFGIIAIGIEKGDELVAARLTDGNQIVFLASHEGMGIRFDEDDVRSMGRPAYGVRGMDLDKDDYIVGMAIVRVHGAPPCWPGSSCGPAV